MKPTVVMLLSGKRSGSTMFQHELCKHPGINHVAYSPHTYFETHHWLKAALISGAPQQEYYGHKPHMGYGKIGARQYLIDCVCGNVPEFYVPDSDRDLIFNGWESLCKQFAKPIFFEKTPHYIGHWACLNLILSWIKSTDFEVKIIGLVRNPMGVMYSAYQLFHTDPYERQFAWASSYRNLMAFKNMLAPENFHLVRYEDIISNPIHTFEAVCEFLGIEYDPVIGKDVRSDSINKWRKDPEFGFLIHENVACLANFFGYTDQELENAGKIDERINESLSWKIRKFYRLKRAMLIDRFLKPLILKIFKKK